MLLRLAARQGDSEALRRWARRVEEPNGPRPWALEEEEGRVAARLFEEGKRSEEKDLVGSPA